MITRPATDEIALHLDADRAVIEYFNTRGEPAGYAVHTNYRLGSGLHHRWVCFYLYSSAVQFVIDKLDQGAVLHHDGQLEI